jgi:hypothetical protein
LIVDVHQTGESTPGGPTWGTLVVNRPVPGLIALARSSGHAPLPANYVATKGTLDMTITTGTPGTDMALASLLNDPDAPLGFILLLLDTSNRPYVMIVDAGGVTVGLSTPSGDAMDEGYSYQIRLRWNATAPVSGNQYATLEVNGVLQSWASPPTSAWTPFASTLFQVGFCTAGLLGEGAMADEFNGTFLGPVRLANQVA